jgi:hypothetical protein
MQNTTKILVEKNCHAELLRGFETKPYHLFRRATTSSDSRQSVVMAITMPKEFYQERWMKQKHS